MEKSEKIILLSTIILVGFVLGVVYHYTMGYYLQYPYPFNTFLANQGQVLCDFKDVIYNMHGLAPYKEPSAWINYFPLAYIILFPFSLIVNKVFSYLIFLSIFLSFFSYMNIKNFYLKSFSKFENFQNIFIITFLAYPVLFIIDRGNFDMFLFIVFAFFIYAFKQEKYTLSAILLAVLNAIKPFWLMFLLLFLFKKKWKEIFLSLFLTFILIVSGFFILQGNFFDQVSVLIGNLGAFSLGYTYKNNGYYDTSSGCSIFIGLKVVLCNILHILPGYIFNKCYHFFTIIFNIITIFALWKEKIYWKQITLLTLNMLMLPFITSNYKLIFLFIPIWLFVNLKEKSKFDLAYTILFGLLLIPKNIIIFNVASYLNPNITVWSNDWFLLSINVILTPFIMFVLFCLLIYENFYQNKLLNKKEGGQ